MINVSLNFKHLNNLSYSILLSITQSSKVYSEEVFNSIYKIFIEKYDNLDKQMITLLADCLCCSISIVNEETNALEGTTLDHLFELCPISPCITSFEVFKSLLNGAEGRCRHECVKDGGEIIPDYLFNPDDMIKPINLVIIFRSSLADYKLDLRTFNRKRDGIRLKNILKHILLKKEMIY